MRYRFPENFWWGSACSALQTEGDSLNGGKSQTTWDVWFDRQRSFPSGRWPGNYLDLLSALETGHRTAQTAEAQQLPYISELVAPDPGRYRRG